MLSKTNDTMNNRKNIPVTGGCVLSKAKDTMNKRRRRPVSGKCVVRQSGLCCIQKEEQA